MGYVAKYLINTTSLSPKILMCLSISTGLGGLLLLSKNLSIIVEWTIFNVLLTPIKFMLIFDAVGIIYGATVLLIAANVILFSKFYIKDDPLINRFRILVMLFVASILTLIFVPNFMALLLGWDGLGITSFILVIYYQNPKSLGAGIVTALINRIGDVIILIAIAMTLNQGHWTITHIWQTPIITIQVIAIVVAGCTKSAQIPFSRWLPAAIAAPTPVSALVHSSTLVTAGVFLLIRFYPFLHFCSYFNNVLLFTAVTTIFIAGISATTECDIKKIIALSTLSQLGVIMARLGLGSPKLALFHIITHALFKALLFICAGQLIADHSHGQDLRWMGNLTSQNPVTTSRILIANIALCGLPFLAGFYSKDLIIEYILIGGFNSLIIMITLVAVGFTALYSIRFSVIVIWGPQNYLPLFHSNDNPSTTTPIVIIALMSISIGSSILWVIPVQEIPLFISTILKLIPLIIVMLGLATGFIISTNQSSKPAILLGLHLTNYASCIIWFLTMLSTQPIIASSIITGHRLLRLSDQSWLEHLGPQGAFTNIILNSSLIQKIGSHSPTRLVIISVTRVSFLLLLITTIRC